MQCVRNGLWPVFYFKVNTVDSINQASLALRIDVFGASCVYTTLVMSGMVSEKKIAEKGNVCNAF